MSTEVKKLQQSNQKLKDIVILMLVDKLAEVLSFNSGKSMTFHKSILMNKLKSLHLLDEYDLNNLLNHSEKLNNMLALTYNQHCKYDEFKLIGKGSFSCVYQYFNQLDRQSYAVKKIGITDNVNHALNEIKIMSKLHHPNIVRYHTCWIETSLLHKDNQLTFLESDEYNEDDYNKFLFIQMELCPTTLDYYVKTHTSCSINDKYKFALGIVNGLSYIHQHNVIHCDLKLENIFIGKDSQIKIGDFGLAHIYEKKKRTIEDVKGTIGYIAPEIYSFQKYTHQSDLYSLGMVFLHLFTSNQTVMEKMEHLQKLKNDESYELVNGVVTRLIQGLIQPYPTNRMELSTIQEILEKEL